MAKKGIAAPSNHPLNVAVSRHRARLQAELTKARVRLGFSSLAAFKEYVDAREPAGEPVSKDGIETNDDGHRATVSHHPRWVRINTLQTTLDEQLSSTFANYGKVSSIDEITTCQSQSAPIVHVDKHVPNLVAVPAKIELSNTSAYIAGSLILQDKASCFPAYLLDPKPEEGDIVDACAAPGNKTTHLAAVLHQSSAYSSDSKPTIYACERDLSRATTLQKMVSTAGASKMISIKAGQDFLRCDPMKKPWCDIGALLLDPSCSGSGIVGRDEGQMPEIFLPSQVQESTVSRPRKKRKRAEKAGKTTLSELSKSTTKSSQPEEQPVPVKEEEPKGEDKPSKLHSRLQALSAFQLRLLLHAFRFPQARKITYSTCSVHTEENENVVLNALRSSEAKKAGWRILPRHLQIKGMRDWKIRGERVAFVDMSANMDMDMEKGDGGGGGSPTTTTAYGFRNITELAEACIRCEKGTADGTQGFFVAAFVRGGFGEGVDKGEHTQSHSQDKEDGISKASDDNGESDSNGSETWEGFN